MLALVGGLPTASSKDALAFYVLKSQKWVFPKVLGTLPLRRSEHSATIYEDKIIIYGGTSDVDYLDRKLQVIETDQAIVHKIVNSS